MGLKRIFQALQDRNDPDTVEKEGPFKCERGDAWLGEGYYFWETFLDIAKWWGEITYGDNNYIICESCFDDKKNILDLNDTEQLEKFSKVATAIKEKYSNKIITVAFVIEYLKKHHLLEYEVIRVNGMNSIGYNVFESTKLSFSKKYKAYLDLRPAVQICLLKKESLKDKYKIIYPEAYCSD